MNVHQSIDMSIHGTARRELPANVEAEQALLGALLLNNAALDAIRVPLEPKHFFEEVHGKMFDAIVECQRAGRVATTVTVKNHVPEVQIGGMTTAQYLSALAGNAVNIINVPDYAYSIMDSAARRAFVTLGQKMEDAAFSLDLEIMEEVKPCVEGSRISSALSTATLKPRPLRMVRSARWNPPLRRSKAVEWPASIMASASSWTWWGRSFRAS